MLQTIEALSMLQTIEPETVKSMKSRGGWETVDMAADSGASEIVIGEEMSQSV